MEHDRTVLYTVDTINEWRDKELHVGDKFLIYRNNEEQPRKMVVSSIHRFMAMLQDTESPWRVGIQHFRLMVSKSEGRMIKL